jgi:hypothetical protein
MSRRRLSSSEQAAIQDQWQEVKGLLPLAIEAPKGRAATYPYPFSEAKNPTLALPAPKKSKPKS